MQINTVIFDLGAVLVDWNPRYVYRQLFRSEEAVEHFLGKVCTNHWNEQQDGGDHLQMLQRFWSVNIRNTAQKLVHIMADGKKCSEVRLMRP